MMPVTRPQAWQGVIAAYRDRLPVTTDTPVVTLHEGGTPPCLSGLRSGSSIFFPGSDSYGI